MELAARSVTFNGAGTGTVELGPTAPFERWELERMTIETNGDGDPMPTCRVYRGHRLVDGTYTGKQNAAVFPAGEVLHPGETLRFTWEGGTAGEVGTAVIFGHEAHA